MSGPSIRPVDASNVDAFVALMYECFGYSFSWPWIYNESLVLDELKDGKRFFFMVYDPAGEARAILGLNRSFPTRQLASMAPFVVDPRVSRADSGRYLHMLLKAIEDQAWELVVTEGLRAVVAQPVCEHRLTQRLVRAMEFVSTGLLLGTTPGAGDRLRRPPEDRIGSQGLSLIRSADDRRRTSETLVVRPVPRGFKESETVALPGRFESVLRETYTALRVPVEFGEAPQAQGRSRLECSYDVHRSFATVELTEIGDDAGDVLIERLEHYRDGYAELVHIIVPLGLADPEPAVEALVHWGCRYGGLLPCYRTSGVLLLQYLTVPAVLPTEAELIDPLARRIFQEIEPDS